MTKSSENNQPGKEMKYVLQDYRSEIEQLTNNVEEYKKKLRAKDDKIEQLKNEKIIGIKDTKLDLNVLSKKITIYEDKIWQMKEQFERDVRLMKSDHQQEIRILQEHSHKVVLELQKQTEFIVQQKNADIYQLDYEMSQIKVIFLSYSVARVYLSSWRNWKGHSADQASWTSQTDTNVREKEECIQEAIQEP